ncbi:uncharacterized protein [Physcomitrium patens]|uniref:uncharacterized protein isoform X2 n=1 Tax=Physcomitrium patens TaxID=3218 RepID=UPI003CCCD1CC
MNALPSDNEIAEAALRGWGRGKANNEVQIRVCCKQSQHDGLVALALSLSLSLSLSPTTDSLSQHEVSNVSTILAPLVLSKFHTMREKLGENHWYHSFLRFSLRRVAPTLPDHCDTNLFRLLTFPSSPYTGQLDVSCDSHFTLYGESFSSHISTLCSGLASRYS